MTGGYKPNGLHFWKYPTDAWKDSGSTFVLTDDGDTLVKGNLGVEGKNSYFNGPLTVSNKFKNCDDTSRWHSNNGTGTFVVKCDSVPASKGCLQIETADWAGACGTGPTPTYSSINCKGRLHLLASVDIIMISRNVQILKSPELGASGNLTVDGNIHCSGINIGESSVLGGGRVHIHSTKDYIYLLSKSGTIIGKEWGGPAYLQVQGTLDVYEHINVSLDMQVKRNLKVGGKGNLSNPGPQTWITSEGIIFGGANNGREANSAQISAGKHQPDSLCIVGMSDTNKTNRKITMWAEGGMHIHGRTEIWGNLTLQGKYINTSDRRLKENIKNISQNDKDKVLQLVPKTYNMIDDDKKSKRYGLIAQEVEELYPELVNTNETNGIKSMNYIELIPLLLEQIKELKKSVEQIKTLINM
jgi:hypothetical protein